MSEPNDSSPQHFKGNDAIQHVVEAMTQGVVNKAEPHGTEAPGHISSASDSARETAVVLMLMWLILSKLIGDPATQVLALLTFGVAMLFWKAGRSAWLAWFRLERLHRVVAEEKYEIEHHRDQEREELSALYEAKGFSGRLLEEVIDVLMADGDRLLHVMLEEELGLSLECQEHPLKQSLGAAMGALASVTLCVLGAYLFDDSGILVAGLLAMGLAAALTATYEHSRRVPAIVWNVALGALTYGVAYFSLDIILT